MQPAHKKREPRRGPVEGRRRGSRENIPAATYSPTRKPCSTIGSGGLNFRVRDGNGWDPSDVATGKLVHMRKRCRHSCRVWRRMITALDPGLLRRQKIEAEEKNDQAARAISIGQLNALQRLHLRPIDVVVFDGSSGGCPREA